RNHRSNEFVSLGTLSNQPTFVTDVFPIGSRFNANIMKAVSRIGFWSGLVASGATITYSLVQLLQLYRVITFPADEILIYSTSLCIVLPLLVEMLALHSITPNGKKFYSHAALLFTTLYAVFVTANYVVQLATVIPQTLQGTSGDVQVLRQSPHSMFWDFDALGYIFMGLACLAAIPLFEKSGFQKWVRLSFIAHAAVTPFIAVVYFYPTYSHNLLMLGFPWAITAPLFMLLLALWLRNKSLEKRHQQTHRSQAGETVRIQRTTTNRTHTKKQSTTLPT
ncbi:MAG TPA: hypothetical protein VFL47_00370, partial [Flavisolibacter sp.]|nr:hypothetical protein [Flavisolibacter sp.]